MMNNSKALHPTQGEKGKDDLLPSQPCGEGPSDYSVPHAEPSGACEPCPMADCHDCPRKIRHMVERFLSWRLPENFSPDAGISFKAEFNEHTPWPNRHEPMGTNLFDATQAEAMVRHMLEGLPVADQEPELPPPTPLGALRFRMEQGGHTQADLARLIGSRAHASEILSGKRSLSKTHIRLLADEWGIPARSLLGNAEPAVLAPEGTEDGRFNSPGIDPEISSLRERVRGLEEALRRGCYIMSEPHASGWRLVVGFNTLGDVQDAHDAVAAALLPLPEGGFGLSVSVAESGISPAAPARTETPGQAGKGAA